LINPNLQPEVLKSGDPRFDDAVNFMEWVSEDIPHQFSVEGDEVIIRG
jgi:poly-gamma-glutamate synthesis protein (capsule biosynthesis protein)